jgi:ATP-dependent RNA helicase RhlE
MSFKELNISEPILRALEKEGYTKPTKIQEEAIPPLLEGRDLLGCAQTGTGKTAAFAIPIIQRLAEERKAYKGRRILKTLVLTPTRELAAQIGASFSSYGVFSGLKHVVVFGGVSQNPQVQALRSGVDILVATPGRLLDLMQQKCVELRDISCFVLDEADRMLDMGFLRDVERVIEQLPEKKQTMLFSATMPPDIEKMADRLLKNPVKVAVTPVSSTVEIVEQDVYYVNKSNKTRLLIHLLKNPEIYSALVFTRTKHGANKLTEALREAGEACDVIHANKSQQARLQALARFKSGKSRVLVATDLVARGIDIVELSHVINFDVPESPEDYVHRIGRTGRAGLGGTAITLCDGPEKKSLSDIEWLTGKKLTVVAEHPYPLTASAETASPASYGRGSGSGRRPSSRRGYGSGSSSSSGSKSSGGSSYREWV